MRVLFFNEGNLGTHILGQGQLEASLRRGVAYTPEIEARFAGLTPMGRLANALANRPLPPLATFELDARTLRWHLVQSLRARRALRAQGRDWRPDVVHVHSQSVALTLAGARLRAPLALSLDTTIADWARMPAWRHEQARIDALIAPSRALERRALRRAAVVLAWTEWAAASAAGEAPDARVEVHHPGIDLERYRPAERRGRERPRVLFVGGRFAEKGGEDLLAALRDDLGERVDLDIVTPADVAERPGVRVHRLGPADERLIDLQQQADVFCLPSHGDAAPWAVLEAMACGTPVLASRVGGIPDMLERGGAGAIAPHADVRALRDALRSLLGDPGRRAALAHAARARCEREYDERRQFARLLDILRDARERRASPEPTRARAHGDRPAVGPPTDLYL